MIVAIMIISVSLIGGLFVGFNKYAKDKDVLRIQEQLIKDGCKIKVSFESSSTAKALTYPCHRTYAQVPAAPEQI